MITKQTAKLDYKPDLTEFISQCERNYYLILKILPFLNIRKNTALDTNIEELTRFRSDAGYQLNFKEIGRAHV